MRSDEGWILELEETVWAYSGREGFPGEYPPS